MRLLALVLLSLLIACSNDPTPIVGETQRPQDPPVSTETTRPQHEPFRFVVGKPIVNDVKRMGINLSEHQYWGTGQIMKNLIPQNPGFEGYHFRSIIEVMDGGGRGFFMNNPPGAWKSGFWDGASYEVIHGPNKGRKGVVTTFRVDKVPTWEVEDNGKKFQNGDWVVVRMEKKDDPTGGWWPNLRGNGKIQASTETRPGSPGERAAEFIAPDSGSLVQINNYFDSAKPAEGNLPHLPLKGDYALRFWAKAVEKPCKMRVQFSRQMRPAAKSFFNHLIDITTEYKEYEIPFTVVDDAQIGNLDLNIQFKQGHLLLDDISILPAQSHQNTTFSDATYESLKGMNPGIIRYWAGQLGDSLLNQISEPFAFKRSSYSRWDARPKNLGYNLPQFLQLCKALNAEPWYVVPITFTQLEMTALIEYLAGDINSVYGRYRIQSGQIEPWTSVFPTIHLELGNEAWNGIFGGGNLPKAEVYGAYGGEMFQAARKSAFYDGSRFNLILGGQAVWAGRNATIHKHSQSHDTIAIAPYLLHKLDKGQTPNREAHRLLFEEVDKLSREGYLFENQELLAKERQPQLAVYEVNLHTVADFQAHEIEGLVAGAGTAPAMTAHMLNMVEMGIANQCFYTLNQYDTRGQDNKRVPLWGAVRQLGKDGRKRPQYLALQLMNRAISGDMIQLTPTGKHLGKGSIKDPVKAWLFKHDQGYNLIAVNLDISQEHPVSIEGLDAQPKRQTRLQFTNLWDHNEERVLVDLEEVEEMQLKLKPGGLALWEFETL